MTDNDPMDAATIIMRDIKELAKAYREATGKDATCLVQSARLLLNEGNVSLANELADWLDEEVVGLTSQLDEEVGYDAEGEQA